MSCSPQQGSKENGSISDSLCHRRKNVAEGKEDKKSWIDPPEEPTTVTLTQAEIESCMQTYEVISFLQIDVIQFISDSGVEKMSQEITKSHDITPALKLCVL